MLCKISVWNNFLTLRLGQIDEVVEFLNLSVHSLAKFRKNGFAKFIERKREFVLQLTKKTYLWYSNGQKALACCLEEPCADACRMEKSISGKRLGRWELLFMGKRLLCALFLDTLKSGSFNPVTGQCNDRCSWHVCIDNPTWLFII